MRKFATILTVFAAIGCGGSSGGDDPLKSVNALVILQRAPRMGGIGDVFQYASYVPGAKLLKLQPPTADGTLSTLCCTQWPEFAQLDIQSYDIAFDAKSIVFSGRLSEGERFGLFILTLNDLGEAAGPPTQLATDPNKDYVYPIFAPGGRIVFVTNAVVEEGAKQHRDEYERGETVQFGSISVDGTDELLGPRNLSHRVSPTMLSDGRILFTNWDHLGEVNEGNLMIMNPDFTGVREAFGKEGTGYTNSYLKAVEIEPGRVVAIGTSRDRTLQAGKILDIRLGQLDEGGTFRQSERNASFRDLTPLVPGGREPSQPTVGRYYDAYPVKNEDGVYGDRPYFLVSWADGPVEQETLAAANLYADFGIYLFDSRTGARRPIFNDEANWEIMPRPLMPRPAPTFIPSTVNEEVGSFLIGSLNVYESTLASFAPGEIVKVRIIEGFSSEEGIPDDFGLTEHEGAALLGEADVFSDGSWAAEVPANVPIHLQPIDKFGMALVNEPVWFSGRAGESRFCGGCHEDRAATTVINPGVTEAVAFGPMNFDAPRVARRSTTFTRDQVVGVPWDQALQPIFDAHCVECHDGTPGPANRTITFTDETGASQSFTFDLRGHEVSYGVGEAMVSGYSASHLSLLGPMMMELEEAGITVSGDLPIYVRPGAARESLLFEVLNPPQLYPYDPSVRRYPGKVPHLVAKGRPDLSADEYYLLILMADMGGQFYSRENAPGASGY